MLQYGPSAGFQPLREWIAQWQGVASDRVLTGNGSLQIVEFLCLGLLKPGDVVFTENPTYDRTITMLRRHGLEVVGIPLQADGPDIDALEAAAAKHKPKAFYVIPDFQNPSGTTCSGEKRRKIAEIAHKHEFLIVEDAPYRPLRYRGTEEPSIYSLAPERTLFMCSFTKLIAPGVRTGFIIGRPDLQLVGLHAASPNKIRRDAAELCGLDEPTGVVATDDIDALIALKPDCVVYTAQGETRPMEAIEQMAKFLAAGVNVAATSMVWLVTPRQADDWLRLPLEQACEAGDASL